MIIPLCMIDARHIAAAITTKMSRAKLTQVQLAARAKVDQSQVSRICAGQFSRRSRNLERVCEALGVAIVDSTETEEHLVKLLRSIVRKRPGKIPAVGRALSAMHELAD